MHSMGVILIERMSKTNSFKKNDEGRYKWEQIFGGGNVYLNANIGDLHLFEQTLGICSKTTLSLKRLYLMPFPGSWQKIIQVFKNVSFIHYKSSCLRRSFICSFKFKINIPLYSTLVPQAWKLYLQFCLPGA